MAPSSSGSGLDRLSALPDEILQQILSLLPAQEAFRTCMLAQSWIHIWMLTRRLRITSTDTPVSVQGVRGFVGRLLRHRRRLRHRLVFTPIDECDFSFNHFSEEDLPIVNRWIWRAVECQVESLRLDIFRDEHEDPWFQVHDESLFSQNLTRLALKGIAFSQSFADFSCCPALKDLEIDNCELTFVTKMKSPSLKRLTIKNCASSMHSRSHICVPCLVSLRLDNPSRNRTPLLESMPYLVEAYVKIGYNADFCDCVDYTECEHVMEDYHSSDSDIDDDASYGIADDTRKCVLLGGLSEATDLKLLSADPTYIFRRDLNWCPTFSKLKTLLLNDYWCEPADCSDLACILKHAPILEKLTILFSCKGPKYEVEMKLCLDETTRSAGILEHLKMVEVKCEVANERFRNVLELLASLNIYHAHNHDIVPHHPANPQASITIDSQGSTAGWFRANGPDIPFVLPLAIGLQDNGDDATSNSSSDATSVQQVQEIQQQEENQMATYFSQLCKVILPMISAHMQAPVDDLPRPRALKRVRDDDDFEPVIAQKFCLHMGQNGVEGRINEEVKIEPNPLAIIPYKTTLHAVLLSIYADQSNKFTEDTSMEQLPSVNTPMMQAFTNAQDSTAMETEEQSRINLASNGEENFTTFSPPKKNMLTGMNLPPKPPRKVTKKYYEAARKQATLVVDRNLRRSPRLNQQKDGYQHVQLEDNPRKKRFLIPSARQKADKNKEISLDNLPSKESVPGLIPVDLMHSWGIELCNVAPKEITEDVLMQDPEPSVPNEGSQQYY